MENKIICVDLDGSLVLTDTLHETAIAAFKKNIFIVFKIFYWLLVKGRVYCKKQLSGSIDVSTLHLPVNQPLLLWLKKQKEAGCKLYLVTAEDQKIADTIAKQITIFETAFGTNWDLNLSGISKRDFLDQQFGSRQYVYVGNGRCDLTVFAHAAEAVVVNNSPHFIEKVKKITPVSIVFKTSMNNFSTFLKALRIHQYAKNLLIFLPLLLGHEINNAPLILSTVLGFICFSLIASSADLSISYALLGMAVNFMAGVVLALEWLPSVFCIALISYYIITVAYSFKLKKLLLVDVFALAILYTTRIVAGMTIMGETGYSQWLLLFSFFFFTSLALMKRLSELKRFSENGFERLPGRAYLIEHESETKMFGICSGFASILIFALYVQSQESLRLYHYSELLFLICPLLLYWILRAWLMTAEGRMHDDPIVFALKDRVTYVIGFIIVVIALVAIG